jgi:uncharacterized protein
MDFSTATKTIDYFCNNGNSESVINFYGGEPLLEFKLMKRIIEYGSKRFKENGNQFDFSVTTNGTLLDEQRLLYCYENDVDIYLSIDGDKKAHESGRGKASFTTIEKVLSLYKDFPEIPIKIKMVITPDNVKYLHRSVTYLVSLGICNLDLNFCFDQKWPRNDIETLRDQYSNAYKFLVKHKAEGGKIRFKEMKKPDPLEPLFKCDAGQDRFAVTPDGFIYGCSMHIPWSKKAFELGTSRQLSELCLGHVDRLKGKKFQNTLDKLNTDKRLCGQFFYNTSGTKCLECEYIAQCNICPVYTMIFNEDHFLVPDWICEIKKIEYQAGRTHWV